MGRLLAWRQQQLVKTARLYNAHPWGYSVRHSLYVVTAVLLGAVIAGARAVDAVAQGVVAGVLVVFVMRFVLGPHWSRTSGT
jgi:hypothetical protein